MGFAIPYTPPEGVGPDGVVTAGAGEAVAVGVGVGCGVCPAGDAVPDAGFSPGGFENSCVGTSGSDAGGGALVVGAAAAGLVSVVGVGVAGSASGPNVPLLTPVILETPTIAPKPARPMAFPNRPARSAFVLLDFFLLFLSPPFDDSPPVDPPVDPPRAPIISLCCFSSAEFKPSCLLLVSCLFLT